MKNFNKKYFVILLLTALTCFSCKKLVEVPPPDTSTSSENLFSNDATAAALLTGIYTFMSNNGIEYGLNSMNVFPGLLSDELTLYNTAVASNTYQGFYMNNLNGTNSGESDNLWIECYQFINKCNVAIEGLTNNKVLTPSVDQQLLGEAKFMRAFCYFYLVNMFGDVPMVTSSEYKVNALLPRSSKELIYQLIISDLKEAQTLLSDQYLDGSIQNVTTERVRPTKWAATAMLSRAYLYTGKYDSSETEATILIQNTSNFKLVDLDEVFLKNNMEAIWQLQPVNINDGTNTPDGNYYIIPSSGPSSYRPVHLSKYLLESFEPNDQRFTHWVSSVAVTSGGVENTYYFPFKYKQNSPDAPVTEYEVELRLGEQFLIRAEDRVKQHNLAGAAEDLNKIRNRAGLPNTTATTEEDLLAAIMHERQVELFTEWGHRWLDLKRTGQVDAVMSTITPEKGGTWQSYKQLNPIPTNELKYDPNLTQNPGY